MADLHAGGYLLGPGSISWRIMRERALLLGAGRMLILQMANPAVSAGVEQHSGYAADPWRRVRHTTDFYLRLVHARPADLYELREYLSASHAQVRGVSGDGAAYSANDPELMLWVHTTVSDSVLWSYQTIFGRLSPAELSRYWVEQRIMALALGIPPGLVPSGAQDWQDYIERQLDRLELGAGAFAVWGLIGSMPESGPRRLPDPLWAAIRSPTARLLTLFTRAGLPDRLCASLSRPWSSEDQKRLRRLSFLLRGFISILPPEIRFSSRARIAQGAVAPPRKIERRWAAS